MRKLFLPLMVGLLLSLPRLAGAERVYFEPSDYDTVSRQAAYAEPLLGKSAALTSADCVGYPPPSRGCWQCSEPNGAPTCGAQLNPAGATPAARYGRPAHCPGGGASYEWGPCCERKWRSAEALQLAWCVANLTAGDDNRAGLDGWEDCNGQPSAIEVMDFGHSAPEQALAYGLAMGLNVAADVVGLNVQVMITRPPYSPRGASISWGDGTSDLDVRSGISHAYAVAGRYLVQVDAPDACGTVREVYAHLGVQGPSIDPPAPGADLCPSAEEVAAWLDALCGRDELDPVLAAGCLMRPLLSESRQAELVCEARTWIRDSGHGGGS